jgi:hypothetical protein
MTQCSGKRCNEVFHILCAGSTLSSKRFRTNFYRCSKCSAVEMKPAKPPKKRNRTNSKPSGEGDGDGCQDDLAAAAFLTNSNPSSSDDECSAAKAATAPPSAPAVDQHPISKFISISSEDSRDLSTFVVKDNARETEVARLQSLSF